ncbi:Sec-independent protein translocase subunit TatA/TatB [Sporomusa acidovorans]|uniref:Sec-independent protein translocase protein TatA n=1 Tax=Sporomusa acidovorans (strain ATCC 49682 / DSM 3132 / Mol) TaxID=1123286 RepID=A0ABZ3J6R8_SPOA4|nr:twin-arginine translocase TatA/TatE family subunit [Sporomusa acidovorans]OZC21008.1 Sec-independent protein translocase protein TatAd [Sporomusa acidovorans DSM 3132]SDF18515.1 sec-independent protein translocase protein TatA [Sporomusa acidovorans]
MFNFSVPELGLILVIALIVFGPGKLPDVGKALGKGIQEVRRSVTEVNNADAEKKEPMAIEGKTGESKK